jgi:UDP-N-acetylmuramate--alanine ligase
MSGHGESIGVSGMHGKSTTTSMLEKIFTVAGKDPTVSCGAVMKDTGSAHRIGSDKTFIFEACEYMDSFLDFYPTTAIILNIEMDHVDYFHSMEQIEESYAKFAAKTGEAGCAVVNCCDDNVMRAISGYEGHLVTFGVEYKDADYSAENISFVRGCGVFDVVFHGEKLCRVELKVFGAHSICDALAAAALRPALRVLHRVAAGGVGEGDERLVVRDVAGRGRLDLGLERAGAGARRRRSGRGRARGGGSRRARSLRAAGAAAPGHRDGQRGREHRSRQSSHATIVISES